MAAITTVWPFVGAVLATKVEESAPAMAANLKTKALIIVSAQLLYVCASAHDSDHNGVIGNFVGLSCKLHHVHVWKFD